MKQYTWEEFYDVCWDLSDEERARRVFRLTSIGNVEEVTDVLWELTDQPAAGNHLLSAALDANYQFSTDFLIEILYSYDQALGIRAVQNRADTLTPEDLVELYDCLDFDLFAEICKAINRPIQRLPDDEDEYIDDCFEDDDNCFEDEGDCFEDEGDCFENNDNEFSGIRLIEASGDTVNHVPSFFDQLVTSFSSQPNEAPRARNRRCDGNCARCPAHYGYRYGRWYYGHGHVHGCEFGGNRGGGSMD